MHLLKPEETSIVGVELTNCVRSQPHKKLRLQWQDGDTLKLTGIILFMSTYSCIAFIIMIDKGGKVCVLSEERQKDL